MVALSSVNLLSLASLARQKHPACQIVLAADRDLNGDGQNKAAAAADACEGVVALPPVFGDWNDTFKQHGGEATRKAIYDAIRPPAQSPFDTMSEAEFTAMSASDKALRVHEHYGEALAVDANGQLLSRYENGIWKNIPAATFSRNVADLFQRLRAPFSSGKIASVVETLKLIIPQQDTPARRLIGFRNGVLDTQAACSARTVITLAAHVVRRGFHPAGGRGNAGDSRAELLALARPCGWQKSTKTRCDTGCAVYGAGEPLRLAALSRSDRSRREWKSILAESRPCSPERITPRQPISTRWKTRASVPP